MPRKSTKKEDYTVKEIIAVIIQNGETIIDWKETKRRLIAHYKAGKHPPEVRDQLIKNVNKLIAELKKEWDKKKPAKAPARRAKPEMNNYRVWEYKDHERPSKKR